MNKKFSKLLEENFSSLEQNGELKKYYLKSTNGQVIHSNGSKKTYVKIPIDFDMKWYKELNGDLKNMTDDELALHYVNYGRNEKRRYKCKLPEDFDAKEYQALNGDLSGMDTEQLKKHYICYGESEKRRYRVLDYVSSFNTLYKTKDPKPVHDFKRYTDIDLDEYFISESVPYVQSCVFVNPELIADKSFTLVIDYEESMTGGTSFFYDVLSFYYQNMRGSLILRIRPTAGGFYIYINNIRAKSLHTLDEIRGFIQTNNSRIQHIFINSIVGHDPMFIEYILSLPQEKSIFTHDYSILCKINQPTFDQLSQIKQTSISNVLYKVDTIYTQNTENIKILTSIPSLPKTLANEIQKKAVSIHMPDFHASQDSFQVDTLDFTFGIIGNISDVKGLKLMIDIEKKFQDRPNVKFFNFGKNNIHIPSQEYKTIPQLNQLLKLVKPNALLFLAIWPETYSYTLTLSLLTELPLYVFDIGCCTVNDRLSKWPGYKNVHYFSQPDDLTMAVEDHRKVFCRTIKNSVRISNCMDRVFLKHRSDVSTADVMTKVPLLFFKNVCLVTSKVLVNSLPYNYSERSKYTVDERLKQTIDTVISIRHKIPHAFIILIDHSNLRQNQMWAELEKNVDLFISNNNQMMRWNCDMNEFKIYGELYQTIFAMRALKASGIEFQNFFKISGRYVLNDRFDFTKFDNEKSIFKRNNNVTDRIYYYTSLYKFSRVCFDRFYSLLEKFYNSITMYECTLDFENCIPMMLDITEIDELGLTQFISCHVGCETFV